MNLNKTMVPGQRFLSIIALSLGFSGMLLLAGSVTPGWVRYNLTYSGVHMGIWYSVRCHGERCISDLHLDDEDHMTSYHPFRPFQVTTSSALVACLFAVVYHLKSRKYTGVQMVKCLAVSAYISLISGILSFVPAATTAANQIFYTGKYMQYFFPYSALLTRLGGVFAFFAVSLILLHRMYSNQTTNESVLPLSSAENQESNTTLL